MSTQKLLRASISFLPIQTILVTRKTGFQICKPYIQLKKFSTVRDKDPRDPRILTGKSHLIEVQNPLKSKDVVTPEVELFQSQLKCVQNMTELLLKLENMNAAVIEDRTISIGLGILFQLCKLEKSESVKKDILNSVGMQKLCKSIRFRGRWMDPHILLNATKVLVFLNAPPTNSTLQVVLKLLSKQTNSFSLKEIEYFHFLLDKTTETPLVSALKLALPVIFESKVSAELERDNMPSLVSLLCYAINYKISDNVIKMLIDELVLRVDKLTSKQAQTVLWELSQLNKYFHYQKADILVRTCLFQLSKTLSELSTTEISTTIGKVAKAAQNGRTTSPFYSEEFIEAACNTLVNRPRDKISAVYCAKWVSLMRYVNIEYLDYVVDILAADPSILLNNDGIFLSIVRTYSMANYRPEKMKVLESILVEHPALTKDLGFQEITIAADLMALDVFPSSLIAKIFSSDYYTKLDAYTEKGSPHLLMLIYNAVKYLYPQYTGPFPPISMIQKWKNILFGLSKLYPLKEALYSGFGGGSYVISGLYHDGFHLDHGIIMRKGGFPMAITDTLEPKLVIDLQMPTDSVIAVVKAFPRESYANNTARMRGTNALELKVIEKFGHPVIPVDVARWQELQDYEKIPFLMHRIREKVDSCWSQNIGSHF